MVKILKSELGCLLQVTDVHGRERHDWREEYVGDGLIVMFEIEGEGVQFIRFYPNEPETMFQRHLTTSIGGITEDDVMKWFFATRNSLYVFGRTHCMNQLEAEVLIDNVYHELGIDEI